MVEPGRHAGLCDHGFADGLKPGEMDSLCSAGPAAPLGGMAAMYLLMSVFHLPPWLKLVVHREALHAA